MDDLFKKLEELNKLLKSFVPKTVQPAPIAELPKIKEIKPISVKAPNPPQPKLPGIAPPSKKDPKKVAEQIRNGQVRAETLNALKRSNNDQWSLVKQDVTEKEPETQQYLSMPENTINVGKSHAFGYGHTDNNQASLIEGLDIKNTKPIGKGVGGAQYAKSQSHPNTVVLKRASHHPNRIARGHDKLSSSKREVLYHNLANQFFGLGDNVPLTAGFSANGDDWSAQKKIDGASHVHVVGNDTLDPAHASTIKRLHQNGDLHKLAIMDNIMANHDRHWENYMVDGNNVHLIDNGAAFDYPNFDSNSTPHFLDVAKNTLKLNTDLHPEAKRWLLSLDPKKAREVFANHSSPQDSEHVRGFLTRLESLQNTIKNNPKNSNLPDLLHANRLSSGPMHKRHDRKAA